MARKRIAIIGAGICGISSAICLQEADPSLQLTIIADEFSPNLTSDGAAGFWEPVAMMNTPIRKQQEWGQLTFDYLRSILNTEEAVKYHMTSSSFYMLYDYKVEDNPFEDIFLYCKRLSNKDLRKNAFPADIVDGFIGKTIVFPGSPYLGIKLREFQQRGGKVIKMKVTSFDELAGKYDVVVNCAGIGARELCKDDFVTPIRGQVLKMKAPWLKTCYFVERLSEKGKGLGTYILPRFDDVIVGGTFQFGNWDKDIDEKQTQAIIERAAEFEPTIRHALLLNPWVGLRPGRNSVRLEKEIVPVASQYGTKMKLQVVHNYGHGGGGLSVFWGCALEVRDLVLNSILTSNL